MTPRVAATGHDIRPIADINTTPLIDVMLVLLIMFVITIPVATDSVQVELPFPGPDGGWEPDALKNKIVITPEDAILWNGHPVNERELGSLLDRTTHMPVEPELQYEPDATASYDKAARVLAAIKKSGVSRFGFVGNERHAAFAK